MQFYGAKFCFEVRLAEWSALIKPSDAQITNIHLVYKTVWLGLFKRVLYYVLE